MHTTVMFINGTQPISRTPVRLSSDPASILVTDDQGQVELALAKGNHTFEIQLGDRWISRPVERTGDSPVFIVDISRSNADMMSSMNTLQISLSSMVGDRFVFENVLGRGGMGIVVKALDRMLNRPVAIKMLSDELRENEEAQQIFLVEARNLATLSHPNLVAIHDILNVDGRVLMVFEYVLGENVEKMIKRKGKIEQLEALRIIIQLTRVLVYLHESDLIHRDLKPANVIIQADGTLKLIDFGLARSLNEIYIRGTRVRGTPAYMAPEQIQGINLTVGTDIYQIGITLYEMLTGDLPFTDGDLAYSHVHMAPPSVREREPSIDPELDRLVLRCLEKSAKDRPQSAIQLLEAFQDIYGALSHGLDTSSVVDLDLSSPSIARRSRMSINIPPQESEVVEEPKKRTGLFAIIGLLALLAVVGAVFFYAGGDSTNDAVAASQPPQPTKPPVEEKAPPVDEAFTVVRGITELAVVSAESLTHERAEADRVAAEEAAQTEQALADAAPAKQVVRVNKNRRRVNKAKPEPEPPEVTPEPVKPEPTPPAEKPEPEPEKVAEKPKEVKTLPVEKKTGGLLSTDKGSKSKGTLLPVNK